ncbi:MAG: Tfp pilus assembly protein FimT/FimU [Mitsuokella sp.]|uniref:pilus assembly FimT family protein n=1 Tax=Mitsuokella sp. TaxID=2049034 RepID=UPI003F0B89C8
MLIGKKRRLAAGRSSERGFLLVEAVLACFVVMILASVAVPRGMALYREAVLEYETQCLLSDIRYMRELSRSTEPRPKALEWDYNGQRERRAGMYFQRDGYVLIAGSRTFREHKYAGGIQMSGPLLSDVETKRPLVFGDNGVLVNPCTMYLFFAGQQSSGRRFILSAGGRCRVERGSPW